MKVLVLISLVGGLMLSSCGGSSSKNNANGKEVILQIPSIWETYVKNLQMIVFSLK